MSAEKLWSKWEKSVASRGMFSSEVEAYLKGERPDLPSLSGRKEYIDYDDEFIKALDGEAADLTRRMLYVISKIKYGGPVNPYYAVKDMTVCCRIGYTFEEIINIYKSIATKNIQDKVYRIAEMLADFFLSETEQLIDIYFTDPEKMITEAKSNRVGYLVINMAGILYIKNPTAYQRFFPVLTVATERLAAREEITGLLIKIHPIAEEFKQNLSQVILKYVNVNRHLLQILPSGTFPSLLKRLGLPMFPYHVLVALDIIKVPHLPDYLYTLFNEDKEQFMETYRSMVSVPQYDGALKSLRLLAIMLKNGEGKEELEEMRVRILNYTNSLNQCFIQGTDLAKGFLLDKETPTEELADRLTFIRYGFRYNASRVLTPYAALYEYSPVAKKLIDLIFLSLLRKKDSENLAHITNDFISGRVSWLKSPRSESLRLLFDLGLTRENLFSAYCLTQTSDHSSDRYDSGLTSELIVEVIKEYEKEATDFLSDNTSKSVEEVLVWIELLYNEMKMENYFPLIELLNDKSKKIRKACEVILSAHEEEIRSTLEEMRPKLKGEAGLAVRRIISNWDNEHKFGKDFTFKDNETVVEFCKENINTDNKKAIAWIPEDLFSGIRFADGNGVAPETVPKYILTEYLSLEEPTRIKPCDKVVEQLNSSDFSAFLDNVFSLWSDNGAEAKKKMILVPYCIYSPDSKVIALRRRIEEWAGASRGAIAAFAVMAIALNGGSVALMMIDSMSNKFPNNQVKNAAKTAFSFAAKALEIPEDVLSDRIVPTLGFNKQGEKTLDYGNRKFTISLNPDFSLSVYDEAKGKTVKSLPAPGTNDDKQKAEAAKKEFSELKKQMKAVIQSQTVRLEKVLMNGRKWNTERWTTLFVENPIMLRFATGLVWGIYEKDILGDMFRYMDDGTFNSVEEEEYILPENASITLVHPIETNAETIEAWKQQLEDYEISQPISQLTVKTTKLGEDDIEGKCITRYDSKCVKAGKITAIAKKYDMIRGEIWDAGSFTNYHFLDKYLGIGVQLNFEWMYMGIDYDEDITLKKVIFYRIPEEYEGKPEDEIKDNLIIEPTDVPKRFLSSILTIFDSLLT